MAVCRAMVVVISNKQVTKIYRSKKLKPETIKLVFYVYMTKINNFMILFIILVFFT